MASAEYKQKQHEHLYKVLMIGEFGVGKTSLIKRYTEGTFSPNYKLTIGVDFAVKNIQWNEHTKINMQLWDIAGHERFGHMTRVYYKYAIAAVIVFDLARQATFDAVVKWLDDVHSKVVLMNEEPVPCLLLANKFDLEEISLNPDHLDNFCKKHNIIGWFPTSAKMGIGLEEAMNHLIKHIVKLEERMNDMKMRPIEGVDAITIMEDNNGGDDDDIPKKRCCDI
ncbi:unnamed protein product [Owenia fusiformis]|uniref:Ras-related protein Rab n=1 Tax=Owenia fusiformis TaxID=6347 RepID=A0A8J1U6C1_OWEFU|nr:unnamed protein product [Owenia fusiformis]